MNISVSSLLKPLGSAISRYHATLFIVFIVGLLTVAVFLLSRLLSQDPAEFMAADRSIAQTYSFNKKTIQRVNELQSSTQATEPLVLPAGRTNPFVE